MHPELVNVSQAKVENEAGKKAGKSEIPEEHRPTVVLMIGSGDSKDCCAANFERSVFRYGKVVEYAQKHFHACRVDRQSPEGEELYKEFKLDSKKPAVLVVDNDGKLLHKVQKCVQPPKVHKWMQGAVRAVRTKMLYSAKADKRLDKTAKLIREKDYGKALGLIDRLEDELLLPQERKRTAKQQKALRRAALKELKLALRFEKGGETLTARDKYRKIRREFRRIPKAKSFAEQGLERVMRKLSNADAKKPGGVKAKGDVAKATP